MYDYRKLTSAQREAVLAERKAKGYPLHAPPHTLGIEGSYLLTAACFEHQLFLYSPDRLSEFTDALMSIFECNDEMILSAWVVQPNHYHLLVYSDLNTLLPALGRLHNGKSTQWNREDNSPGRKVWYRCSDRVIRSERHRLATINYIHANPVKHGFTSDANAWPWSSLHMYLEEFSRDALVDWWREYPVQGYGKGWDDYRCEE